MKRFIRITFVLTLTFFSFYYTDKIIYLSKLKDPIMIKINNYKSSNNINYVNGIVTKNTMLVGSSGKKINSNKSYEKMKSVNSFNEKLLEYENIKPVIRKDNNLDKLIRGKITSDKNISFVFELNDLSKLEQIMYILDKNNINATFFIDGYIIEKNINVIKEYNNLSLGYFSYNNNFDSISFKYMKGMFKSNDLTISNYCLYKNDLFLNTCKNSKINTISPITISSNLYNYIKYKKENGLIYKININDYTIKELNSTIIYLKGKGYNLITLEDLLKE